MTTAQQIDVGNTLIIGSPGSGLSVAIGGLWISNGSGENDCSEFQFPTDRPTGYLLYSDVADALVRAVDNLFSLNTLVSIGSTDVCLSYAQLQAAIEVIAAGTEDGNPIISDENLRDLREILMSWRDVPASEPNLWWNKTPFNFGVAAW